MSEGKRRILAIGRGANEPMIRHFARMTGKVNPKICLLPTALGDHPARISWWETLGPKLGFEPHILKTFISSFDQKEHFEDILLSMDAIYVGGGNTLNMLAIWGAHGIDQILKTAWESGILLGGGSAGGICWFESGLTDSRPVELTAMPAMGWLKGSYAPHYQSEPGRREFYHKYILDGELHDGYGCDEAVGMYFEGTEFVKAYGTHAEGELFRVERRGGDVVEMKLPVELIEIS